MDSESVFDKLAIACEARNARSKQQCQYHAVVRIKLVDCQYPVVLCESHYATASTREEWHNKL